MSENRRKKIVIRFRVDEEEYKKIIEKIELSNMNISRYMRNAALKREIIIYDFSSLFELSAQISKIGNNINQIAKKLNQGGMTNKSEINYLKSSLENINDVLMEIYQDIQESQGEA